MKFKIFILFILVSPISAFPWSDHTFTTYFTLKNISSLALQSPVRQESLNHFLKSMKKDHPAELSKAISNAEKWALKNMPRYAPIPENIFYDENKGTGENLETIFMEGIRINPHSLLFPYIRDMPFKDLRNSFSKENIYNKKNEINYTAVTIPFIHNDIVTGLHYFNIAPSQSIPAYVILASAADEPDLGLDISLFADNNSEFGKKYGFGNQPFGDKRVTLSSGVPFHYGAYHEWSMFYLLAPQTQECYAEYRIKLYREIAKAAFAAHHDYWGWRFLGYGLHYVQDLTQPFHTNFFPDSFPLTVLSYYGLSLLNDDKPLTDMINIVANRHFLVEDFVLKMLRNSQLTQASSLKEALTTIKNSETNLKYNDDYPRQVISAQSFSSAAKLSQTLAENFPEKYVHDPKFLYMEKNEDVIKTFQNLPIQQQKNIINNIIPVLEFTGVYTRIYLKDFL